MAKIIHQVHGKLAQIQKNLECPICLELLTDPVGTKCDHQFCNFCILALLQSTTKSSAPCPLCKEPITKRSLIRLETLNGIVQAVRNVVQAVQLDTGIICTPPRGPPKLSQEPSTHKPSPKHQKIIKQKNVRNARSKKIPVFIDEDGDSDEESMVELISTHENIKGGLVRQLKKKKNDPNGNKKPKRNQPKQPTSLRNNSSGQRSALTSAGSSFSETDIGSQDPPDDRILEALACNSLGENHPPSELDPGFPSPRPTMQVLDFVVPSAPTNKDGGTDPYDFISSQRTPRKVKQKTGKKKKKKPWEYKFGKISHKKKATSSDDESQVLGKVGEGSRNVTSLHGTVKVGGKVEMISRTRDATSSDSSDEDSVLPRYPMRQRVVDKEQEVDSNIQEDQNNEGQNKPESEIFQNQDEDLNKSEIEVRDTSVYQNHLVDDLMPLENTLNQPSEGEDGGEDVAKDTTITPSQDVPASQPPVLNRNHGKKTFATAYKKGRRSAEKIENKSVVTAPDDEIELEELLDDVFDGAWDNIAVEEERGIIDPTVDEEDVCEPTREKKGKKRTNRLVDNQKSHTENIVGVEVSDKDDDGVSELRANVEAVIQDSRSAPKVRTRSSRKKNTVQESVVTRETQVEKVEEEKICNENENDVALHKKHEEGITSDVVVPEDDSNEGAKCYTDTSYVVDVPPEPSEDDFQEVNVNVRGRHMTVPAQTIPAPLKNEQQIVPGEEVLKKARRQMRNKDGEVEEKTRNEDDPEVSDWEVARKLAEEYNSVPQTLTLRLKRKVDDIGETVEPKESEKKMPAARKKNKLDIPNGPEVNKDTVRKSTKKKKVPTATLR